MISAPGLGVKKIIPGDPVDRGWASGHDGEVVGVGEAGDGYHQPAQKPSLLKAAKVGHEPGHEAFLQVGRGTAGPMQTTTTGLEGQR